MTTHTGRRRKRAIIVVGLGVLLALVSSPAIAFAYRIWVAMCSSTEGNPILTDPYRNTDWVGPEQNLESLIRGADLIVYGEVVASDEGDEESLDAMPGVSGEAGLLVPDKDWAAQVFSDTSPVAYVDEGPRTLSRVKVIETYFGSAVPGDHFLLSEDANPRPAWRPGFLACNRTDDQYHLREASRVGDLRLWFLFPSSDGKRWTINNPFRRLDLRSGQIFVTTTRPSKFEERFAPLEREAFLRELKSLIRLFKPTK